MVRLATIILSIIGVAIAILAVTTGKRTIPDTPLARPASVNPFGRGVAALGIVEPAGRIIEIAAPEPGLVTSVFVGVGDVVSKDQPLMQLDTRAIDSQIVRAEGELKARQAEIDRWRAIPRAEDIPPLEAEVQRAQAHLVDAQDKLQRASDAVKSGAMSARDVASAQASVDVAKAEVASANAALAKLKAGGWKADLQVAEANLESTKAQIAALQVLKERMTVRAPREGTVLRRDVEPGEYVQGPNMARPPLVLGDLSRLDVRAQVDEEDFALIGSDSKAVGRTRGASPQELELTIIRIEPFARPKLNLSGANSERTDTRIIDVVMSIVGNDGTGGSFGIVPGQAVDVFFDATAKKQSAPGPEKR
ncbi:MAG: efflux RND transporter periplasmic adaptor subunit [Phycisphaeraceae bacterium]|nr:efflux RND transporter periplasmic adaptor subunit [Phycisphaeraceae bacterium]